MFPNANFSIFVFQNVFHVFVPKLGMWYEYEYIDIHLFCYYSSLEGFYFA